MKVHQPVRRPVRGGSWHGIARASYRFRLKPSYGFEDSGFRCVLIVWRCR